MNRKETTKLLSKLLENHIAPNNDTRIYYAKEVTFDYISSKPTRVDYMQFKPLNNTVSGIEKGDFYCYEVKSSVKDFKSKHGHNFYGDYNYYIMPLEVFKQIKNEVPWDIGVYCPTLDNKELKSVSKARRRNRTRPINEMLLMMFRSFKRDYDKNE